MHRSVIQYLAPAFEQYLTLHGLHATRTYSYAKRRLFDLPVIEHTRHGPKCKTGESWVYVAVPASAHLAELAPDQRLYIGAQSQDRMFRGDSPAGENFHHAEMRRGRGHDNLESFLQQEGPVNVFRIAAIDIFCIARAKPEIEPLARLMQQQLPPRTHQAWWLEQYVLHHELATWRWNKDGASSVVSRFLSSAQ